MFTFEERRTIKQFIQDAIVRRYSEHETAIYIKRNLNLDISTREIYRIKRQLRRDSHKWISELAETRDVYINQYHQRIQELEANQRELWMQYHSEHATISEKIKAQEVLAKITWMITQLYDVLPVISAVRPINNIDATAVSKPPQILPIPTNDERQF
jgi:hypothetical protein